MKAIFFLINIAISGLVNAQFNYSIVGQLKDAQKGKIYLLINDQQSFKDSTTIVEGKFKFNGSVKRTSTALLSYDPDFENNTRPFYIEPAKIKITGDGNNLSELIISGSKINEENSLLTNSLKNMLAWEEQTRHQYRSALDEKNTAKVDSLDQVFLNILSEKRKIVAPFILNHTSSIYSAMLILEYYNYESDDKQVSPLFFSLNKNVQASESGLAVKKMLDAYSRVGIGKIMPEIEHNDTAGRKITLSSLLGKYVLVDFWASWCDPCRRANPAILKVYNQFHNKGFEVLGISYDKVKENWKLAIQNDHLPWINISELKGGRNSTSDYFYIKDIPANFLLDRDGRIVAKNISISELSKKLEEVL